MPGLMRERIVIGGSLAQKPGYGGHTWVFLQYLLGFRRLGWDVLLLDRLQPELFRDRTGSTCAPDQSVNARYVADVAERFGLRDRLVLLPDPGQEAGDRTRRAVLEFVGSAALLLNVMGFITDPEVLAQAQRRVFLDIDPGYGQMWAELGLHDAFAGYDDFVTIGENIGCDGCEIPTRGLPWITTPQPVVLDQWPMADAHDGAFTSVGSWRGRYGTVSYGGRTYGHRVHEFRRFVELPRLTGRSFELALAIDDAETADLDLLRRNDWRLVDPAVVAASPDAYRHYVQRSAAELMVAKNMYVAARSGWMSDRSICYLASGKPVVAQDTGLDGRYEPGAGLLTFSDLDEASAAVDEVCGRYASHARAARALAEEHFDSDKVLGRLLERLSIR
jgi:hypothetical protein